MDYSTFRTLLTGKNLNSTPGTELLFESCCNCMSNGGREGTVSSFNGRHEILVRNQCA